MPLDADDALVPPPDSEFEFGAAAATGNPGPPPSSQPPEAIQEPPDRSGAQEQPEQGASADEPPEFDERAKEPFLGLLWIGHLEQTFKVFGHDFHIATPTRAEKIEMGLLIKPYQDTVSAELAWQTATVAAYLLSVDGEDLPEPVLTSVKDTAFSERYAWVAENMKDVVIDEVFTKCLELDAEVRRALEAMGKASG